MTSWKTVFISATFVAEALAQAVPIPSISNKAICEGTIRPDYQECRDSVLPQTFGGVTVGPEFMQGATFKGEDCQIRVLKCGSNTAGAFEVDDVSASYPFIERDCGQFNAGGVFRIGDACIYVDTPNNTFGGTTKRAAYPAPMPLGGLERRGKRGKADIVNGTRGLEKRQCGGTCYTYTEQVFIAHVRGFQQRVCDNILPKDARCDQSRSVTTTESFSFSAEVGSGLKDIVSLSASFSKEVSESSTETITTAIPVKCENGGYIVWYPLLEISRGECGVGKSSCDGGCLPDTVGTCEYRKPIMQGEGRLSGAYDVVCI